MADNTSLNAMSGGDSIASDDISGVKIQRVKIKLGAGGVDNGDVASGNPMPVSQTGALPAGSNNIGDVDVLSMPVSDRTTDNVGAVMVTDALMNDTTALTPKFASIAVSGSGNNTIVSAVNPKKIRVVACSLIANGTVNAKWQSGASGTDLTGLAYLVANTGYILPFNPLGWFETASNTLLNLNLSGAIAVGGCIVYVEV
jgi:hypothetical protein